MFWVPVILFIQAGLFRGVLNAVPIIPESCISQKTGTKIQHFLKMSHTFDKYDTASVHIFQLQKELLECLFNITVSICHCQYTVYVGLSLSF